ncbi:MAG: hypothetical protein JO097_06440 [Acidobacteriaceae bacterium]|nr:hypothetical protein [Acidobacteriaceae bacterium]
MTSRQARRERRAAERKAKKVARKADLHATAESAAPARVLPTLTVPRTPPRPKSINPELLDEFTPEFLAYANSTLERIEASVAAKMQNASSSRHNGFVSQDASMPAQPLAQETKQAKTRREVNRANAQFSTGPRTPTGKCNSSRNSLKHGLASGTLIIPSEDPAAFESLLESLLADHQPANTTEELLVHQMAQSFWLGQRALRFQNDCFTENGVDEKRLALFLRYQTTHERAFHKALSALLRLQKTTRAATCGFVSQHDKLPIPETRFVSQNEPDSSSSFAGFIPAILKEAHSTIPAQ